MADKRLVAAKELLAKGGEPEPLSVREFLWWWFAQRRTRWQVLMIREELREVGLVTVPDFESVWLDSLITFQIDNSLSSLADLDIELDEPPLPQVDPTYRVGKLACANRGVVSVPPDAPLQQAVTLMMQYDYSQLPVMNSERDVKGSISWTGIGMRLAMGVKGSIVSNFMDRHHEIRISDSLFEIIDRVRHSEYVLVRAGDGIISGIVTASDLSQQFMVMSEAFLTLSEIENLVRGMIERKFSLEEIQVCKDPSDESREVTSVAKLSIGEYIRLLENKERWGKFNPGVDRKVFCKGLDDVRKIRNEVMHFDPDGISESDLVTLQKFSNFLRTLDSIEKNKRR